MKNKLNRGLERESAEVAPVGFWEGFAVAYDIFSAICNPYDWQEILRTVSARIASVTGRSTKSLNVIDVGSGTGEAGRRIRGFLNYDHSIPTSWTLVEPDAILHSHHKRLCIAGVGFSHVSNAYANLREVGQTFDVILAIHSTYYLGSPTYFMNAFAKMLNADGHVIIVSLPNKSPFFLGRQELVLPNTSTEIENWINQSSAWQLLGKDRTKSRMKLTFDQLNRVGLLDSLYRFLTQGKISLEEFKAEIFQYVGHEIDLRDEIVVLARRSNSSRQKEKVV